MTDTTPHPTSIAVWGVSSPVVVSRAFTVKVGAKCSLACPLTGQRIVVRDDSGNTVGEGRLGETPSRGTSALYEADVTLAAPAKEDVHIWAATLLGAASQPPHEDASARLSFRTVGRPEHRVTVTVRDRDAELPLEKVEVRLGVYRAETDGRGQASFEVPKGRHDLHLWKVGYETDATAVEVTEDVTIQVTAVCAPDGDPDDEQVWM